MKSDKVTRCPVCGEQLSPFARVHVREKHPEYFNEVRKWQHARTLFFISAITFMALNFVNNISYSDRFLGLLFSVGGLIVASFFFFTLLKLRSVAKKYGVSWRKTLSFVL